jgi:hypothetical protein
LSKKNTDRSCAHLGSAARVIVRAPSWRRPNSLFRQKGKQKFPFRRHSVHAWAGAGLTQRTENGEMTPVFRETQRVRRLP